MISINNRKMKMKVLYIGIAILIGIFIYIFTAQKVGGNREREFFNRFNSSNIHGELEYAKIRYHLCAFKIKGIGEEFYFDPITSDLNNDRIFEYVAEEGDIIIKKAYSDILELKKGDKVFIYKFRKYND